MSWLPSLYCIEHTVCERDGEFEGWEVGLTWASWRLFLVVAKRERTL